MTLPGGWGSWNIIGWVAIGIVGLFALLILAAIVIELWRMAIEKMRQFRCRHGWHVPADYHLDEEVHFYDLATNKDRWAAMHVIKCRHCSCILSSQEVK